MRYDRDAFRGWVFPGLPCRCWTTCTTDDPLHGSEKLADLPTRPMLSLTEPLWNPLRGV
jgi:hypothetical protein